MLRFRSDGRFRIVQLTDTHFWDGGRRDARSRALISRVLELESPDLVVLTGDIVEGEKAQDPTRALRDALAPMLRRGMAWTAVLGNHDDEGRASRRQLARGLERLPHRAPPRGPRSLPGVGNGVLAVRGSRRPAPAALLYFFDSHAYATTGAGTYAWIRHEQVAWYRRASERMRRRHGALPGLAFFHIPLPEYEIAWEEGYDVRGERNEPTCCPQINSGLFAAFHERGDVLGAFCGHDHLNDFDATLHGVRLCYGRNSGYGGYGGAFPRGARVIELREGQRRFETWLRLADGTRRVQRARRSG
jgi:3',5'-cyclic AMP phosphodiesterase CpdA